MHRIVKNEFIEMAFAGNQLPRQNMYAEPNPARGPALYPTGISGISYLIPVILSCGLLVGRHTSFSLDADLMVPAFKGLV